MLVVKVFCWTAALLTLQTGHCKCYCSPLTVRGIVFLSCEVPHACLYLLSFTFMKMHLNNSLGGREQYLNMNYCEEVLVKYLLQRNQGSDIIWCRAPCTSMAVSFCEFQVIKPLASQQLLCARTAKGPCSPIISKVCYPNSNGVLWRLGRLSIWIWN